MRKWSILALTISVVALGQHKANADLKLSTYDGVESVYDTEAQRHWIRDLTMFNSRTYDEQIDDIAALGGSPGIDGPWHMATTSEMMEIWPHDVEGQHWSIDVLGITAHFLPTTIRYQEPYPNNEHDYWYGRYDDNGGSTVFHHYAVMRTDDPAPPLGFDLGRMGTHDSTSYYFLGAWVASEIVPVPLPGAALLGVIGMGYAGMRLRRRDT